MEQQDSASYLDAEDETQYRPGIDIDVEDFVQNTFNSSESDDDFNELPLKWNDSETDGGGPNSSKLRRIGDGFTKISELASNLKEMEKSSSGDDSSSHFFPDEEGKKKKKKLVKRQNSK